MAMRDFNRDLDRYIASRRNDTMPEFTERPAPKPEFTDIKAHDDVEDDEDMELQQEEEETTKKPGFFARIFKKVSGNGSSVEVEEDVAVFDAEDAGPELEEDVRAVLKMSYQWLAYLPKNKLDTFKESPDFEMYKNVLKKYGLIK